LRPFFGANKYWEDRLAVIAGLASHLKPEYIDVVLSGGERRVERFAEQLAQAKGDRPLVSELRFRRLLQRDRVDLYPSMIRILRLLDGKATLHGLAESHRPGRSLRSRLERDPGLP